jgi:hypothetical protein
MWPDDPTRKSPLSFHKEIRIPKSSLQATRPRREYQRDIAIRDRAIDLEDARRKGGSSTTIQRILPHTTLEESPADQDSGYKSTDSLLSPSQEIISPPEMSIKISIIGRSTHE